MGAAAGTQVRPAGIGEPHGAVDLLLAAVGQGRQLVGSRIPAAHRGVRPHGGVGLRFRPGQLVGGKGDVGIHAHRRVPDVKAHILRPEKPVQGAAEDVLPGVLFHMVQTGFPVDLPRHRLPHRQRGVGAVPDDPRLHPGVCHPGAAQGAGVGGLAAAFRVKGGAVQGHTPAFVRRLTGQHPGGEPAQKGVLFVQFFGRLQQGSHPFGQAPTGLRLYGIYYIIKPG